MVWGLLQRVFTSRLDVGDLTVFPAPSKPNIKTPNSSLRVKYSYSPLSKWYMKDSQCGGEQGGDDT